MNNNEDNNYKKLSIYDKVTTHNDNYMKEIDENKNYMNYYMHDPKLKRMNNPL
jgi:hypothetical protein